MIDIGNQVRFLREKKVWGLKTLSTHTGLSISYLSDIERGRTVPTLETIEKIATAFEMPLIELLGSASIQLSNDERFLIEAYRAGDTVGILRLLVDNADNLREVKPITDENGEVVEIPF